jgi:hypothetical protein
MDNNLPNNMSNGSSSNQMSDFNYSNPTNYINSNPNYIPSTTGSPDYNQYDPNQLVDQNYYNQNQTQNTTQSPVDYYSQDQLAMSQPMNTADQYSQNAAADQGYNYNTGYSDQYPDMNYTPQNTDYNSTNMQPTSYDANGMPVYSTDQYQGYDQIQTPNYNEYDPNLSNIDYSNQYSTDSNPAMMSGIPLEGAAAAMITKKPNSNIMLFGIAGLITALLLTTLGIVYFSFLRPKSDNMTNTNISSISSSLESISSIDSSNLLTDSSATTTIGSVLSTGGSDTPASRAKTLSATTLPAAWLQSNFKSALKPDGTCDKVNICGENADGDDDNLSNLEEYNFSASPAQSDTDGDGIGDGDEVYVYFTNPTKKDSDADTYEDYETVNCFDPILNTNSRLTEARQKQITNSIKSLTTGTLSTITKKTLVDKGINELNIDTGFNSIKCTPPAN